MQNQTKAHVVVDNAGNQFPGKTTLADLAQFTPLLMRVSSHDLSIYRVQEEMEREWPHEIENYEYEYLTGYCATFKDGSKLHVGAWAEGEG